MKYASWVVISLVLAGISIILGLESWDQSRSQAAAMETVQHQLDERALRLESDLRDLVARSQQVAASLAAEPGSGSGHFHELAAELLKARPDLLVITHARQLKVRQAYPLRGNEDLVGLDFRLHPEFMPRIEQMMRERHPVIDGEAWRIHTGRSGLVIRAPILDPQAPESSAGLLGMVSMAVDLDAMLRRAGLLGQDRPFSLAIRSLDEDSDAPGLYGDTVLFDQPHAQHSIELPGLRWALAAVPRAGLIRTESHAWLIWGLGSSLILALLLFYLYRRGVRRGQQAEPRTDGLVSLRTLLLLATLIPLPLIISLAGWLIFTASIQAVERLEQQRIDGLAAQLQDKIVAFFEVPRSIAQFNLNQLEDGLIGLDRRVDLLHSFVLQMRQQPLLTGLAIGTVQGDFLGVSRLGSEHNGALSILQASQADGGVLRSQAAGEGTRPDTPPMPEPGAPRFDPRLRPWYQSAIDSGSLRWYPPYRYRLSARDSIPDAMGMGMSAPLHDTQGQVVGVLAADVALSRISAFLRTEMTRIGGVAFLAESGGDLLANSENEPVYHLEGDSAWRLQADDSDSPMIRDLGRIISQPGRAMGKDLLGPGMQRYVAHWQSIRLPDGPQLTLAMALPESRYAEPAQHAFNLIGLLILGIWILGMAVAAFVAWWLSRPLLDLSLWAKRLAFGDRRASPRVRSPVREIVSLAQALARMAETLQTNTEDLEKQVTERTHALVQANQRLLGLSMTDGLTGLANRRHFDEVLARETARARRDRHPVSLLMIDVDWFKSYNDQYGHPAGDEVLRRLGQILLEMMRRPGDLVARYGGEEFAVILAGLDCDAAWHMAQRVREKVMELAIPHAHGHEGRVTVSIGVAELSPEDPRAMENLVAQADVALYAAKAAGRNRVECASSLTDHPSG